MDAPAVRESSRTLDWCEIQACEAFKRKGLEESRVLIFKNLERPFGWRPDPDLFEIPEQEEKNILQDLEKEKMIATASKLGKILGYIPFLGILIGTIRMVEGFQKYQKSQMLLKSNAESMSDNLRLYLQEISNRSLKWIKRGFLETIPFIGGATCLILDWRSDSLAKRPHY